jgi:NAD(P)-dependent dehydrogenase (short-subunit alcohol dehydrogenase family)
MQASREFADRHVMVTGGGTGIGAAIAEAFAPTGARITIVGRRAAVLQDRAAAFAATLAAGSATIEWIAADLTDKAALDGVFAEATRRMGNVDVLVNNAGQAATAPWPRLSPDMLRQLLEVNLVQVVACTQHVLPGMMDKGAGRIVNIASTAALRGYAYASGYCAAKHAVLGFTRAVALEVVRSGITVNAVCPGYTETPLLETAIEDLTRRTGREAARIKAELAAVNPAGRLVQPAEVVATVLWLASAGAQAITGQAIAVAHGETM